MRSKNSTCEYVELSPPPRRRIRQPQAETRLPARHEQAQGLSPVSLHSHARGNISTGSRSAAVNDPTSQNPTRETELLDKIKQLEAQLAKAGLKSATSLAPSPNWDSSEDVPQIAGTFHVNREAPLDGKAPAIVRTIMHKTRIFGQSHWIHGVTQASFKD